MLEIKQLTRLQIIRYCEKLEKENRKLKEFKAKQEEMMFLIWASIELAKPKTYRDAEKLQKGKELYEKLYKEELYYLREENIKLKEDTEHTIKFNNKIIGELKLENKKLKADYIKLSKIVETTWWYKASYVNELRDKIAKLEQELKIYKNQYKHTMWEDYIDEDLYDLDC